MLFVGQSRNVMNHRQIIMSSQEAAASSTRCRDKKSSSEELVERPQKSRAITAEGGINQ